MVAQHHGSRVEHQDVVVFVYAPFADACALGCKAQFTSEFGGGDAPQPFGVGSTSCSFLEIGDVDVSKQGIKIVM